MATYFAQQDILRGLGLPSAEKCKSLVGLIGIMFYAVLSGPIQFLAMLLQRDMADILLKSAVDMPPEASELLDAVDSR